MRIRIEEGRRAACRTLSITTSPAVALWVGTPRWLRSGTVSGSMGVSSAGRSILLSIRLGLRGLLLLRFVGRRIGLIVTGECGRYRCGDKSAAYQ